MAEQRGPNASLSISILAEHELLVPACGPVVSLCAPLHTHFRVPSAALSGAIDEQFLLDLPRNTLQHAQWLRLSGSTADEHPLNSLRPENYRPCPRYVPASSRLCGQLTCGTHVVFNSLGWAALLEHPGLPEFIVNRAVAYIAIRGGSEGFARAQLSPNDLQRTAGRVARWAVGIERATGLATIGDRTSQRHLVHQFLLTGKNPCPFTPSSEAMKSELSLHHFELESGGHAHVPRHLVTPLSGAVARAISRSFRLMHHMSVEDTPFQMSASLQHVSAGFARFTLLPSDQLKKSDRAAS